MQWKPVSPVKTTYLTGKTSNPVTRCTPHMSLHLCLNHRSQKDHRITLLADAPQRTGRVVSCLHNASFC